MNFLGYPSYGSIYGVVVDDDGLMQKPKMEPRSLHVRFCQSMFGTKWHHMKSEDPKTLRARTGCERRLDHVETYLREIVYAEVEDDLCAVCVEALRKEFSMRDLFIGPEVIEDEGEAA